MGAAVSARNAAPTAKKRRFPEATILAKVSTVGTVTTEFFVEEEGGPAVRYRKTCNECGITETFSKGIGWQDIDVFMRHAPFAGMHYRLHSKHPLGPDAFGTPVML